MATAVDNSALYSFDEVSIRAHPLQHLTRFKFLVFKRVKGRFAFNSFAQLYLGMAMLMLENLTSIIGISLDLRAGNRHEAEYAAPVLSVALLTTIRALTLLFKAAKIAQIYTALDDIFPKSIESQQRMGLPRLAAALERRFSFINRSISVALVLYFAIPLFQLAMHHEQHALVPVEFHQLPSWLPFRIKQSYRLYPYVYSYETFQSIYATFILLEWDYIFTVIVAQLCMHFEHLNQQIQALDASDSKDAGNSKRFYANLRCCMAYHQQLNSLNYALSDVFNVSILLSDTVSSFTLCLYLYLMSSRCDIVAIILALPTVVLLLYLIHNVSQQVSKLQELSDDIKDGLYNHNWYEGTTHYRKYVAMWMQHANKPYRLIAFQTFEVNMEHFRNIVMLAYKMLTFLKSIV